MQFVMAGNDSEGLRYGIIWHTQGSGKSLIMVWLAKLNRENVDECHRTQSGKPHQLKSATTIYAWP